MSGSDSTAVGSVELTVGGQRITGFADGSTYEVRKTAPADEIVSESDMRRGAEGMCVDLGDALRAGATDASAFSTVEITKVGATSLRAPTVHELKVTVAAGSPDDQALQSGGEVEVLGILWRAEPVGAEVDGERMYTLHAVGAVGGGGLLNLMVEALAEAGHDVSPANVFTGEPKP